MFERFFCIRFLDKRGAAKEKKNMIAKGKKKKVALLLLF